MNPREKKSPFGYSSILFELDTKLTQLQKDYLIEFIRNHRYKRFYEKSVIKSDFAICTLGLPPVSEFYLASRPSGFTPAWSIYWHPLLFSSTFHKIVFTLLCIQKRYFRHIDKQIFFKIIEFTAPTNHTHYRYQDMTYMNRQNILQNRGILGIDFDELPKCKSCGKNRICNYMGRHPETTDVTPYTRPEGLAEIRFSYEYVYSNFDLIVDEIHEKTWIKFIEETFLARWGIKRIKYVLYNTDTSYSIDSDDSEDDSGIVNTDSNDIDNN